MTTTSASSFKTPLRDTARRLPWIRRAYWATRRSYDRVVKFLRSIPIAFKWLCDRRTLPLSASQWPLYHQTHDAYLHKLRHLPNLVTPQDFNDKIQWLKLFDQDPVKIQCSDKLAVREFVSQHVGSRYLTDLYQVVDRFEDIVFSSLPESFALKTTHATGGVVLVPDKNAFDHAAACKKLNDSIRSEFGWATGEWPYTFIRPRIFAEELLPSDGPAPPPDYKFHCAGGEILWLQYISNRGHGTREAIVSPNGQALPIHFDQHMEHSETFTAPEVWGELLDVAKQLSAPFKYVRVDLYAIQSRVMFGELTFFPLAGHYTTVGQRQLGSLIPLDTKAFRSPIVGGPGQFLLAAGTPVAVRQA